MKKQIKKHWIVRVQGRTEICETLSMAHSRANELLIHRGEDNYAVIYEAAEVVTIQIEPVEAADETK